MSIGITPCLLCNDTGMAQVFDAFAPCGRCSYNKADPQERESRRPCAPSLPQKKGTRNMTIMETLADLRRKDFRKLTQEERAVINANEAIDGLYAEVIATFGSVEKAAKHLGLEPANVNRTIGKTRTRRMSAWLFASLCRACGIDCIATSSVDALKELPNLTLESFLVIRCIGGELSDVIQMMGRQG